MKKQVKINLSFVEVEESDVNWDLFAEKSLEEFVVLKSDAPHSFEPNVSFEGIEIHSHG